MAYTVTNPPKMILQAGFSNGRSMWLYESTDAHTTVDDASYFANGFQIGMKVGDLVCVIDTNLNTTTWHRVTAVAAQVGTGFQSANRAASISAATLA